MSKKLDELYAKKFEIEKQIKEEKAMQDEKLKQKMHDKVGKVFKSDCDDDYVEYAYITGVENSIYLEASLLTKWRDGEIEFITHQSITPNNLEECEYEVWRDTVATAVGHLNRMYMSETKEELK